MRIIDSDAPPKSRGEEEEETVEEKSSPGLPPPSKRAAKSDSHSSDSHRSSSSSDLEANFGFGADKMAGKKKQKKGKTHQKKPDQKTKGTTVNDGVAEVEKTDQTPDQASSDKETEDAASNNEASTGCQHCKKSISFSSIKRKLKNYRGKQAVGLCDTCTEENNFGNETGVWICLFCGNQGCGRYSENQHAIKHYETSSVDNHCVAVNLPSFLVWCYKCDDEIPSNHTQVLAETLHKLRELVNMSAGSLNSPLSTAGIETENLALTVKGERTAGATAAWPAANGQKETWPKPKDVEKEKADDGWTVIVPKTRSGSHGNNSLGEDRLSDLAVGIKGLTNLGNTCFFNSVMQNLAQTHQMAAVLADARLNAREHPIGLSPSRQQWQKLLADSRDKEKQKNNGDTSESEMDQDESCPPEPIDVVLDDDSGQLSFALGKFVRDFHGTAGKSTGGGVLSPSGLLSQVCKKAPRFRGMHQQDSHELLRHLLDGLKTEESARVQAGLLRAFGFDGKPKKEAVCDQTSRKLKAYFNSSVPMVDKVFGGELLQSIKCLQCGHISQKMEPFLDLSLPIVETKKSAARASEEKDLEELLDDKKGKKSKHQLKKEKKAAKRGTKRKAKSQSVDEDAKQNEEKSDEMKKQSNTVGVESENLTESKTESTEDFNGLNDSLTKLRMENGREEEAAEKVLCNGVNLTESESENEEGNESDTLMSAEESEEEESPFLSKKLTREIEEQAHFLERMKPLSPEDRAKWSGNFSIGSCLSNFTAVEVLAGKNRFGCVNCAKIYPELLEKQSLEMAAAQQKKIGTGRNKNKGGDSEQQVKISKVLYTEAEKNYLIYSPPAVLTLHLKRFQQMIFGTRKVSKYVEFPLLLDIAPFCSKESQRITKAQSRVLYSLYGIVSHSGGLHGGHYVAYVKVRPRDPTLTRHFLTQPAQRTPQSTDLLNSCSDLGKTDENRNRVISNGVDGPYAKGSAEAGVGPDRERPPVPPSGEWYHVSDSHCAKISQGQVLGKEAYLLFYERVE